MDDEQLTTRLWMGGVEVDFLRWTAHGLIYTRVGSRETMANLTRGTLRRLLQEGTLRIEGYRPDWAYFEDEETPPPAEPPVAPPSSQEP